MKYLIYILFPVMCYSQEDTCFTAEQIQDISFTLDSLYEVCDINDQIISKQRNEIELLNQVIRLDSMELAYREKQIDLLKNNIDLYVEREKYIKPRWYDHKAIWFGAGILTTVFTTKLAIEIIK